MAIDLGFSGQESDVNRACSAFGLDTVNYRAFPNNGPVPAAEPEPVPEASARPPESVAVAALAEPPPALVAEPPAAVNAPLPSAPQPWASAPAAQWAPPPALAAAPVNYPPAGVSPVGVSPVGVPPFGVSPVGVPPAAAYPSGQRQSHPGMQGGGFSLLQQALPPTQHAPAPMPAFAMARAPLQPMPPSGVAQTRPAAPAAANPESFGIAFGTAFNAAFGHTEAGAQAPAGHQWPLA